MASARGYCAAAVLCYAHVAQTYRSRHAVVQKPVSIAGSAVLNNIATGYVCLWCVRHEREGQPGMTNQAGETVKCPKTTGSAPNT